LISRQEHEAWVVLLACQGQLRLAPSGHVIGIDMNATLIRPGRLVIVDLRDEFMEKDQALRLFVVLLELFAEVTFEGRKFNKLVVFDEAHKYIESPDLVAGLVEVVREMRHKGTSIMVASQDPPSLPVQLIELSSQIILHKFNSPAWLKHIQKANAALGGLIPERWPTSARAKPSCGRARPPTRRFAGAPSRYAVVPARRNTAGQRRRR